MIQSDMALIGSPKVREYILTIHRDGSRTITQKGQCIPRYKSNNKRFMPMVARSVVQGVISRRYEIQCMFKMAIIVALTIFALGAMPGDPFRISTFNSATDIVTNNLTRQTMPTTFSAQGALDALTPKVVLPDETITITQDISVGAGVAEVTADPIIVSNPSTGPILETMPTEDRLIKNGIQETTITADTMELTDPVASDVLTTRNTLMEYDLPDEYYPGVDFSSFQAFMCYTAITDRNSPAWKVVRSNNAYTDEYGFRRYKTTSDQYTVDGNDDYVIALGTFYKEKGTCGGRYLIVTTTGSYTAIAGDEKADVHTDSRNMISTHGNGQYAGMIEWILDLKSGRVPKSIWQAGTVTAGPVEALKGEIIAIYSIE